MAKSKKISRKIHRASLKHRHKHPSWLNSFKKFRIHHRIFFYVLGAFGAILIWRGVWDLVDATPIFNHPVVSLLSGVGLTVAAGVFFELV